jgi:ribosome biogenesis protein NSA1
MRILAAAEDSGSLKEIICSKGTDTSSQTATQPEKISTFDEQGIRSHIQKFAVVPTSQGDVVVACRAHGNISFYKTNEVYDLINTATGALNADSKENDKFIALNYAFGMIITASEQGKITIIDPESIYDNIVSVEVALKSPLSAFTPHPEQEGVFAYGGKENDVKIVRLYDKYPLNGLKMEQIFQAKNVKNDKLDLRVPIWVTNILFINLAKHTESSWEFITTTRYGQVRKYDTVHGRKPTMDKKLSEKPLVQVAKTLNGSEIICADTHAMTALFHLEKGTLVGKYKGSVGAVQSLYSYLSGKEALLVTGALDRYVRVFNIDTREQVAKVYIGSKVSAVWLLDDSLDDVQRVEEDDQKKRKKKVRKSQREAEKEDPDKVWEDLDELEGKTKKRKTAV